MRAYSIVLALNGVYRPEGGLTFVSETIHAEGPGSMILRDALVALQTVSGLDIVRIDEWWPGSGTPPVDVTSNVLALLGDVPDDRSNHEEKS